MSLARASGVSPGGLATMPPWAQKVLDSRGSAARVTSVTCAPSRAAARAAVAPAMPVPRTRTSVRSDIGKLQLERDVRGPDRVREPADGHAVGAGERLAQLLLRLDLGLDGLTGRKHRPRRRDRRPDAAGQPPMVVLDEHHVGE